MVLFEFKSKVAFKFFYCKSALIYKKNVISYRYSLLLVDHLKNYFYMKYKLLLQLFVASFIFSACSKSRSDGVVKPSGPSWTLTVDGKNYSWSGPFPATVSNNGQASYVGTFGISPAANIVLNSISVAGLAPQMITIQLSNTSTGTFSMTPDSYLIGNDMGNSFSLVLDNSKLFTTVAPGSNISFKVNSLSDKTFVTNGISGYGYVTGTFSGTIGDLSGGMHTISGSYNCVRMQ